MSISSFRSRLPNTAAAPPRLPLNHSPPQYLDSTAYASPDTHAPSSSNTHRSSSRAPTLRIPPSSSKQQDSFFALFREEEHLHKGLQTLIDAQSEGLLAGFAEGASEYDSEDRRSSSAGEGSRTQTSRSPVTLQRYEREGHPISSRIITPIRQPTGRKISLHGARRGISRAISELAALKAEERILLESEVEKKSSEISTARTLTEKREGLESQIRSIEERQNAGGKMEEMRREERVLDAEIRELEMRLWEMRARQVHLVHEIQGLDNRVQSQLSSYTAALQLADKEARDFLRRPPAALTYTAGSGAGVGAHGTTVKKETSGIWALPADRRTLAMADEHFREEQRLLQEQLEAAETERKALEEGSGVWKAVVREVSALENLLRAETQRLPPPPDSFPHRSGYRENFRDDHSARYDGDKDGEGEGEGGGDGNGANPKSGMTAILHQMHHACSQLKSHLAIAERRGWNLLICCIGAELEAVIEGSAVLQEALRVSYPSSSYSPPLPPISSQHASGTATGGGLSSRDSPTLIANDVGGRNGDGRIPLSALHLPALAADQLDADVLLQGGVRLAHSHSQSRPRPERNRITTHEEVEAEDEDDGPGPDLLIACLDE